METKEELESRLRGQLAIAEADSTVLSSLVLSLRDKAVLSATNIDDVVSLADAASRIWEAALAVPAPTNPGAAGSRSEPAPAPQMIRLYYGTTQRIIVGDLEGKYLLVADVMPRSPAAEPAT